MTTQPDRDLISLARLCELAQATPNRVERAIDKADVMPALRLNGVAYFDMDTCQKILEILFSEKSK